MALPTEIDPRKLANQGATLRGNIDEAALTRVRDAVERIDGPLSVDIAFTLDESGAAIVTGQFCLNVTMTCQRCLEQMPREVAAKFAYQIIWSEEQAINVPKDRDPWIVADRLADLSEILEDEVLLAMPIVNVHPMGSCVSTWDAEPEDNLVVEENVEKDNPFGVLKQFKVRSN